MPNSPRTENAPSPAARCPLCGKPRAQQYRPFCGRGCRDRDLGRWFGETYRMASDAPVDADDDAQ